MKNIKATEIRIPEERELNLKFSALLVERPVHEERTENE